MTGSWNTSGSWTPYQGTGTSSTGGSRTGGSRGNNQGN